MVIVKNLTEELTKLGLVDFLRNVAKEKGLVLKETALNGTEWQMSALTSRGTEMLAISITEKGPGLRFLNLSRFSVNENGERKRKAIIDNAYSYGLMLSGTDFPRSVIVYRRRMLAIDRNKLFQGWVEKATSAILSVGRLPRK